MSRNLVRSPLNALFLHKMAIYTLLLVLFIGSAFASPNTFSKGVGATVGGMVGTAKAAFHLAKATFNPRIGKKHLVYAAKAPGEGLRTGSKLGGNRPLRERLKQNLDVFSPRDKNWDLQRTILRLDLTPEKPNAPSKIEAAKADVLALTKTNDLVPFRSYQKVLKKRQEMTLAAISRLPVAARSTSPSSLRSASSGSASLSRENRQSPLRPLAPSPQLTGFMLKGFPESSAQTLTRLGHTPDHVINLETTGIRSSLIKSDSSSSISSKADSGLYFI